MAQDFTAVVQGLHASAEWQRLGGAGFLNYHPAYRVVAVERVVSVPWDHAVRAGVKFGVQLQDRYDAADPAHELHLVALAASGQPPDPARARCVQWNPAGSVVLNGDTSAPPAYNKLGTSLWAVPLKANAPVDVVHYMDTLAARRVDHDPIPVVNFIGVFRVARTAALARAVPGAPPDADALAAELSPILPSTPWRHTHDDEGVVSAMETLKVTDPVSFAAIDVPVRPMPCEHAQCSSFPSLLASFSQHSALGLECPVCRAAVDFSVLCVDATFANWLASLRGLPAQMRGSAKYRSLERNGFPIDSDTYERFGEGVDASAALRWLEGARLVGGACTVEEIDDVLGDSSTGAPNSSSSSSSSSTSSSSSSSSSLMDLELPPAPALQLPLAYSKRAPLRAFSRDDRSLHPGKLVAFLRPTPQGNDVYLGSVVSARPPVHGVSVLRIAEMQLVPHLSHPFFTTTATHFREDSTSAAPVDARLVRIPKRDRANIDAAAAGSWHAASPTEGAEVLLDEWRRLVDLVCERG